MTKEQSVLDKRTQLRFQGLVVLEMAIERFMSRKNISKSKAIEEFLMGSETLKEEMLKVRKDYDY
jgi:hypothetical protein